jgi:hypothetical protein
MLVARTRLTGLIAMFAIVLAGCQMDVRDRSGVTAKVVDPYDYNYCGGVPVYPVIGIGFSTLCGPRNQVNLGRYGTLMWLYPSPDGKTALYQGTRKLTVKELKHLSLLAEVADLADPAPLQPGAVNYRLGINFSGRATKRIHAVKDQRYTPANRLFDAMLALVPGKPALPDCMPAKSYFDPYELPKDRRPITLREATAYQEDHGVRN